MSTKFSTACSTCCVWLPVACIPRSKTSTRRDAARRDRAAHRHRRVCDVEVILRSLALAYRVFETPDRIARLTRISVDAQRRLALAADHLLAATEAIAVALTGAGGRGAGWHDAGGQTVAAAVRVIAARLAGIGIRHDAARNLQAADRAQLAALRGAGSGVGARLRSRRRRCRRSRRGGWRIAAGGKQQRAHAGVDPTTGHEKAPSESDGKHRDIGVCGAWAAPHLGAVPLEVRMEDGFWVVSTGGAIFVAPHESARRAEHHFCQRTYARSLTATSNASEVVPRVRWSL